MKKLNLFIFVLAGLFVFTSCEDSTGPTLSTNVQEPSFVNAPSGQSYMLLEANSEDVALELEWTRPGVGFRAAATYTIEMAEAGTDFADPEAMLETTQNSVSITVSELNSSMLSAGFPENVETQVDLRVITEINEEVETMYSSAITIGVTPYFADTGLLNLFLVGSATSAGWDNNNNNMPMVRLPGSDENNFSFTGRFLTDAGNEFKLLENLGAWQPQWGDDQGALASSADLGNDPNSLLITGGTGYYTVEIDIEARTYSIASYDASGAATYTTIGLIGDGTPGGWDADTEMTQSSFDDHMWYLNDVELVDGFAKFRANGAWATNWGAGTEFSGFGVQDGANIPVTAGTYDIWFNDLTGGYMFIQAH